MKNVQRLIISLYLTLFCLTLYAQNGLSVHGYLSQAFAITDGNTLFGINKEGTFDYRNLALQFRYDSDEFNTFIVQFSHKRLGVNPEMSVEDDIQLDWAFFEHHFDNELVIKVGKIQQPFGIYNELRDVGVLLPFYQVPYMPYGERNYTGETVDGMSISYDFQFENEWSLQNSFYFGQWDFTEWLLIDNPLSGQRDLFVDKAKVKNAFGGQIWLAPPMEGLRFGLASYYGEIEGGVTFQEGPFLGKEKVVNFFVSFDLTKDKYFFRSEYGNFRLLENRVFAHSLYGQFGYQIWENVAVNIQSGIYQLKQLPEVFSVYVDRDFLIDHALGINYRLSSNIIIKAETHYNKSYLIENAGFTLDIPAYKTVYSIFSISSSF